MFFPSLHKFSLLAALVSLTYPVFCRTHADIRGRGAVATNTTTVLEYFVCNDPVKDVKWSLPDPNSGQISQNGVYKAPDKPGNYRLRAIGHRYPTQIAETEIRVEAPYPLDEVWRISHNIIGIDIYKPRITHLKSGYEWGHGLRFTINQKGIKQWTMQECPPLSANKNWVVEIITSQGKTFSAPAKFDALIPSPPPPGMPKEPYELSGYYDAFIENSPDLLTAKTIQIRNEKGKIVHQENDVCNQVPTWQAWILHKDDIIWFRSPEIPFRKDEPIKWPYSLWEISISWDNGVSWMPIRRGDDSNQWSELLIPQGGLRDVSNPLLRFSISRGFCNTTKVDTLQNFLDKTPKHLEKEITYKPKPRVDPVVPPDDPNDNF